MFATVRMPAKANYITKESLLPRSRQSNKSVGPQKIKTQSIADTVMDFLF
jgi:hypothetical protein